MPNFPAFLFLPGPLFYFAFFSVLASLALLCAQQTHLLMVLLSLELLMLSLFLLAMITAWASLNMHLCLILLTLAACEASLGLAILVALIKTHGNDYVHSFNLHKC
nr:NADH dehydrogenase subunit 4L [Puncturella cf. parvinobilis]